MKLVAVSVVKNESDMIESFVRHTAAWVDRHLIFDHESTDGTREILAELAREGLPIELFAGQATANLQQGRSNHLTRLAFAEYGADWVLPLDADEIIVAANRASLEAVLASGPSDQPLLLGMHNFSPTTDDDPSVVNPIERLRHRQSRSDGTCKVVIPRALGMQETVSAGKGSHTLHQSEQPLEGRRTPEVWLAHFALRTPLQQMLRVVTAELQRLSRGPAHAGVDTHYRLGFQLLCEDPAAFLAIVERPSESLVLDPVPYRGSPLRYSRPLSNLTRGTRAFLPFLESLARNHGRMVGGLPDPAAVLGNEVIERLDLTTIPPIDSPDAPAFFGFTPVIGWEAEEGPVASAFLPRFHWTTAPETGLDVTSDRETQAWLTADLLTYAEAQVTTVVLNGVELHRHVFTQINQKDTIVRPLKLRAGVNRLAFRHRSWLRSAHDPRKLAVIFLSLRIALNDAGKQKAGIYSG